LSAAAYSWGGLDKQHNCSPANRDQALAFLCFFFGNYCGVPRNTIESEFSALARLCLKSRIPTKEKLENQVLTLIRKRSEKKLKVNWKFSITDARRKLNRHYRRVKEDNKKYTII
jgi:hypothetical protein